MKNNVAYYLLLNKIRQYTKLIKRNKIKCILALVVLIILMTNIRFEDISFISEYFEFIVMGVFIYAAMKLYQKCPSVTVDYRLMGFRIISLKKLKLIIILKSFIFFIIIFGITLCFRNLIEDNIIKSILILCIINTCINIISIIKVQIDKPIIINLIFSAIMIIGYFSNSVIFITIVLVVIIIYFMRKKYLTYDEIMKISHMTSTITTAFINNNFEEVFSNQASADNSKKSKVTSIMKKCYNNEYSFEFYKEISRAINNKGYIMTIILINLIIAILAITINKEIFIYKIAVLIIISFSVSILDTLNNGENKAIKSGFCNKFKLKDIFLYKYFAHAIIMIIPLSTTILLLNKVNIIIVLIGLIIMPLKSIIRNYKKTIGTKVITFFLDFIMWGSIFI